MKTEEVALNALNRFYSCGYLQLHNQNSQNNIRIDGFFMSDCGILFIRNLYNNLIQGFSLLLNTIKQINYEMLRENFILITSIAYGQFKYENRLEFVGIEKNPIYGNAYISAYLDTERGNPKIQPGQCRIVSKNLPIEIINKIKQNNPSIPFNIITTRKGVRKHFYFYWMVQNESQIAEFEKSYRDSYNLKYSGMIRALKKAINNL